MEPTILSFIVNAGPLVKFVMFLLFAASVVSWTIIIRRYRFFAALERGINIFDKHFAGNKDLIKMYSRLHEQKDKLCGVDRIFYAGVREFLLARRRVAASGAILGAGAGAGVATNMGAREDAGENLMGASAGAQAYGVGGNAANVNGANYLGAGRLLPLEDPATSADRAMNIAVDRETLKLQTALPILATIGSVSPYVGLFGTVWGIMTSFRSLSGLQHATIAMVAPGISEALIATAIGLFAAIPAVVSYNRFSVSAERMGELYNIYQAEISKLLHQQHR